MTTTSDPIRIPRQPAGHLGHLLLTPGDPGAPARVARLRALGLSGDPDPTLDAFARRIARATTTPYAGVNFVGERGQRFAGLHRAPGAAPCAYPARELGRDRGWCPHVVVRGRALVLEDVREFARYGCNPVVGDHGIRSYLGAPVTDRATGMVLGTVCAVDVVPRRWGTEGLALIKDCAAELVELLARREDDGERGRATEGGGTP
ncbi:GAF domain-containing protein [Streptomyces sp. BI20]|uniref:GAF domain-containing protein n=1 Tax=Streptomyces sp. BI20 TaxID=3403460 RepID=UPI003C75B63F